MKRNKAPLIIGCLVVFLCAFGFSVYVDSEEPRPDVVVSFTGIEAITDTQLSQITKAASESLIPEENQERDISNCIVSMLPAKKNQDSEIAWSWCDNGDTVNFKSEEHQTIVDALFEEDREKLASTGTQSVYELHAWSNYGGSRFYGVTSWPAGCSDGSQFVISSYSPWSWNNIASSMKALNTCETLVGYDLDVFGQPQYTARPNAPTLGSLNNSINSTIAKKP